MVVVAEAEADAEAEAEVDPEEDDEGERKAREGGRDADRKETARVWKVSMLVFSFLLVSSLVTIGVSFTATGACQ